MMKEKYEKQINIFILTINILIIFFFFMLFIWFWEMFLLLEEPLNTVYLCEIISMIIFFGWIIFFLIKYSIEILISLKNDYINKKE